MKQNKYKKKATNKGTYKQTQAFSTKISKLNQQIPLEERNKIIKQDLIQLLRQFQIIKPNMMNQITPILHKALLSIQRVTQKQSDKKQFDIKQIQNQLFSNKKQYTNHETIFEEDVEQSEIIETEQQKKIEILKVIIQKKQENKQLVCSSIFHILAYKYLDILKKNEKELNKLTKKLKNIQIDINIALKQKDQNYRKLFNNQENLSQIIFQEYLKQLPNHTSFQIFQSYQCIFQILTQIWRGFFQSQQIKQHDFHQISANLNMNLSITENHYTFTFLGEQINFVKIDQNKLILLLS